MADDPDRQTSGAEALAFAEPIFLELSKSMREAGAEDFGWPEIAAGLMDAGWFDDYDALLTLAANEERWLGERAHAYGLGVQSQPLMGTPIPTSGWKPSAAWSNLASGRCHATCLQGWISRFWILRGRRTS